MNIGLYGDAVIDIDYVTFEYENKLMGRERINDFKMLALRDVFDTVQVKFINMRYSDRNRYLYSPAIYTINKDDRVIFVGHTVSRELDQSYSCGVYHRLYRMYRSLHQLSNRQTDTFNVGHYLRQKYEMTAEDNLSVSIVPFNVSLFYDAKHAHDRMRYICKSIARKYQIEGNAY